MKSILSTVTSIVLVLFLLLSCNKNDTADSKFSWTYNGTTYIAKQHTAYTSGLGAPSIIAGLEENTTTTSSGPRANLTSLQTGTYSFASGTGNRFEYIDEAGNIHVGSAGNLTITKNANNLLDGNFSVLLANNKTITGEFSNTPVKP